MRIRDWSSDVGSSDLLDPPAPHPRMIAPAHLDRRVRRHLLPRLLDLALADEHQPRHHQRLRPRPRFGEPAIDEHLIDAGFRHRRSQRFGSGGAPACLAARTRNASIWITRSRVSIEWRRAYSATLNA